MYQLVFLLLLAFGLAANGQDLPETRERAPVFPAGKNSFRVATQNNSFQPFASLKSSCVGVNPADDENCRGNSRYEGFCVDLLQAIREQMPRKPDFQFVNRQENSTGERLPNGRFNGIVGQLQRQEVDLACAPMASSQEMSAALDYSRPIVNSSVSIMMRRPGSDDSCLSTFFRPFTWWMWFSIFLIFFLLLLARLLLLLFKKKLRTRPPFSTHHQHGDHHQHRDHHHHPEGQFLHHNEEYTNEEQQQVRKVQLIKNIRRLLKYLLYFFSAFVLIFYLASLTAQLVSRHRQIQSVRSLNDLTSLDSQHYGMIRNGEVHNFFRQSTDPAHQQLLRNVETQTPSGFVSNYQEGIDRVRDEEDNYAFIVESTANDFANREDCNTYQAGPNFYPLNYVLAMPKGAPWRAEVDAALENLRANGKLEELRQTWWEANGACPSVEDRLRLGWSSGLCGLILLLPLLLLLGLLYFLIRHFMANRKPAKRTETVIQKRSTEHQDQRRLHSPVIATTGNKGHPNVNYEHQPHHHQHREGEVIQANDLAVTPPHDDGLGHGRPIQGGPHVINHPIRVEEGKHYNGRHV